MSTQTDAGYNPPSWGGASTSQDFEPFLGDVNPFGSPTSILGHALTSFSNETIEPVQRMMVRKSRGRIQQYQRTLRGTQKVAKNFTVLLDSAVMTPIKQRAMRGDTSCRNTIYARRLCPNDERQEMAYVYDHVMFSPLEEVEDLITIDDVNVVSHQTECVAEDDYTIFQIGGFVNHVGTAQPAWYAVAFADKECEGCAAAENSELYFAGGDGVTEDGVVAVSQTRGGAITEVAAFGSAASEGDIFTSIYTHGNVVLVGFTDDIASATATGGGTVVSVDGGQTAQVDTNLTLPIFTVTRFGNVYLAGGGTNAGGAKLYQSQNGRDWVEIESPDLPADETIISSAIDDETGVFYLGTNGGTLLKGRPTGNSFSISDISANLSDTFTTINGIACVEQYRVDVVGAQSGGSAYNYSTDEGAAFSSAVTPATGAIVGVGGHRERTGIAFGKVYADKDILTDNTYSAVGLQDSVTLDGNITAIAYPVDWMKYNYAAAVTSEGEVVFMQPFYPGA